jgi:myosin-5
VSTLSNTSELIADPEDDGGYGSVRHVPNRSDSEDVGLVLKLQQRLKTVEKDKASLATRVEELERESPTADVRRAQDMIRLQELEMENAKIKDDLKNLRRQAATENEVQLPRSLDMLMSQFDAMSDELDRRREECIQLRTVLANTTLGGDIGEQTTLNASRLNGGEPFAEDNEILMAFESQKRIIRHLENELQEEKASSQRKIQIEREEVERLRLDNEQQAKLLAGALHRTPQGQTDAVIQHEISRLTADNLDLQEKNDLLSEQLKKYRSQMKLAKKVKQEGVPAENQEASPEVRETVHSSRRNERSESLPVVRKKETNYLGMFDFNMGDEKQIARNLVYGESFWCCDEIK